MRENAWRRKLEKKKHQETWGNEKQEFQNAGNHIRQISDIKIMIAALFKKRGKFKHRK